MRIEVLCTGDELLTGLTADTNSPYFMGKLLDLGQTVAHAQCVPDDRAEITAALIAVRERADHVLVSGGLGPTSDDFTAECAAAAAGVPLEENPEVLARIQERFQKRGLVFTPNNARQAQVPKGSEVVQNPVGSAPMFIQRLGRCTLYFVPGVPAEYRALVDAQVLPRLKSAIDAQPDRQVRALRILKTMALAESHLDALVAPVAQKHPQVTFGFRTQGPENQLKLLAEASTAAQATQALQLAETAAREVLGKNVFGVGDDTLAGVVARQLTQASQTLAVAESCTGGALAEHLTAEEGASQWFFGSIVPYLERAKSRWLDVPEGLLKSAGAVSAEVAASLAQNVREQSGADWGLSVTGFAGPTGGNSADPVGTVYLGISGRDGTATQRHAFGGNRERVRRFAVFYALDFLRKTLEQQ